MKKPHNFFIYKYMVKDMGLLCDILTDVTMPGAGYGWGRFILPAERRGPAASWSRGQSDVFRSRSGASAQAFWSSGGFRSFPFRWSVLSRLCLLGILSLIDTPFTRDFHWCLSKKHKGKYTIIYSFVNNGFVDKGSERWESNPDLMLPKHTYYHYTTLRNPAIRFTILHLRF